MQFAMNDAELEERFLAQEEFLGDDKPINKLQPIVSVSVATYQHAAFIRQCLDGILMQETSFPFEVIVGEDESTDGTREICIEYARKHQDRIRLFLRSRSLSHYVKNGAAKRLNGTWCRRSARGKHIAICEGDDYWISKDKLQKQVDFLESHPECSMCFHNVLLLQDGSSEAPHVAYGLYQMRSFYDLVDMLSPKLFPTASVVFRRNALVHPLPEWCSRMPMGDWPMWLLLAREGRIGYLSDTMSVYRLHSGGIWSQMTRFQQLEKIALALDIVLTELACKLPNRTNAIAVVHRAALDNCMERADYRAASNHAGKLLGYAFRCYLRDMRTLLAIISRAHFPWLWHAVRKLKIRQF